MTNPGNHPAAETLAGDITVPWTRVERFVGQLTHDVRNGLNALELQLTFLGEISTDPEAVEEVKRIRASLADITRQLQAVRTSTAGVAPHGFDYPGADFFEDLRERFERGANPLKARLEWRVEVGDALIRVDPELTMAALLELLANAASFAGTNDPVVLAATVRGPSVQVELREPCPAPPADDLAEWGRTPLQSTRRAAYGLGLFRARRIVEAQGGRFEAEYAPQEQRLISRLILPVAG